MTDLSNYITEIQKINASPDDVFVLKIPDITVQNLQKFNEFLVYLNHYWNKAMPNVPLIVMPENYTLININKTELMKALEHE